MVGASPLPNAVADPQRIVLVRLSHLGDLVHTLAVYHAVRGRFPAARLAWIAQPEFAELPAGLPGIERVIPFGRSDGARAWWRLGRELRDFGAELAIDCQGNVKSAVATRLTRAPRRVGLDPIDWREPIGARVLTETAPAVATRGDRSADEGPHAMERMIALARHVAADADLEPRSDPEVTEDELERGRELCDRWLPHGGTAPVIVQLGHPTDVRSWPLERHRQLVRELVRAGTPALVLSGPGERAQGDALSRELGESELLRHVVGQRGLRDLAAFFTVAGQRGARFVSADSGPMHLAAACGLAVVSLAGPQSHRRTGPWPPPERRGSRHRVLRSSEPLDCAPCLARHCEHAAGPVCMRTIGSAEVRTALASR